MTNREFGCAYIEDARVILVEAKASLEQEHFHRAVRKCQESVEMALKGLPRVAGIEYPKAHRLGRVLLESAVAQVVSVERLQEIARIADELTDAREDASMGPRNGLRQDCSPARMPSTLFRRLEPSRSLWRSWSGGISAHNEGDASGLNMHVRLHAPAP